MKLPMTKHVSQQNFLSLAPVGRYGVIFTCFNLVKSHDSTNNFCFNWQQLAMIGNPCKRMCHRFSKTEDLLQQQILERDALRLQADPLYHFESQTHCYLWTSVNYCQVVVCGTLLT